MTLHTFWLRLYINRVDTYLMDKFLMCAQVRLSKNSNSDIRLFDYSTTQLCVNPFYRQVFVTFHNEMAFFWAVNAKCYSRLSELELKCTECNRN